MKIVLCGPKGIGKSTLGRKIARFLEVNFIDLDDKIDDDAMELAFVKNMETGKGVLVSSRWKTILDKEILDFFKNRFFVVLLKADTGILWSRFRYGDIFPDMNRATGFNEFSELAGYVYKSVEEYADIVFEIKSRRKSGIHRDIGNIIKESYVEKDKYI